MSLDELAIERKKFQDKIDGPENDGRITSDGSADLDYWMEMVEDLTKEIAERINPKGKGLDFDSYLKYMIHNIGMYLIDPQHRGTGKTYNMCKAILAAAKSGPGNILVLGISEKHCRDLQDMLLRVAEADDIKYVALRPTEVKVGESNIIFEKSKHTELRSAPKRFVDHFTEEQFVLDGLRNLRGGLAILKKGK